MDDIPEPTEVKNLVVDIGPAAGYISPIDISKTD